MNKAARCNWPQHIHASSSPSPSICLHRLHCLKIMFSQRALCWKGPLDDSWSSLLLKLRQLSQGHIQLSYECLQDMGSLFKGDLLSPRQNIQGLSWPGGWTLIYMFVVRVVLIYSCALSHVSNTCTALHCQLTSTHGIL